MPVPPEDIGAASDEHDEREIAHAPEDGLRDESDVRFEQERIGQEGQQAAGVACRVKEIRIAGRGVSRVGEPFLQKRGGRREHEKRQADDERQLAEQPEARVAVGRRRAVGAEEDRKQAERQQDDQQVHPRLAADAEHPRGDVRVAVAQQQRGLEKDHAGVPDRGRSAAPRQEHFADHRFDREQERRAEKER